MKTVNNTFGVTFYLKKQKATQSGKAPIYARITVNGKRLEISVKRSIEDKSWNPVKGMAKGSREEIAKLNQHLDKFKAGIVESYQQLAVQKKLITAELLKNTFLGKDQQDFTICKLIAYHNAEEGKNLEWGTMKNYMTKMLGHTKLSTTQIYVKVVESKLGADMAMLRVKLA